MIKALSGVVVASWFVLGASFTMGADTASQPATAAASQPASEIVLVQVGPLTVTQADLNYEASRLPGEQGKAMKGSLVQELVARRLFSLYMKDHPDLVDPQLLEKKLEIAYKAEGVKNRDELVAKLKARNDLRKLDDFLDRARVLIGRSELIRRAEEKAADEKVRKEVFEADPSAFDGSRMRVRHILVATSPWDTPAQLAAKRERLAKIREDLVSGRRTWEQCIDESDEVGSRVIGGQLGMVPRHLEKPEAVAKAAFELKPGETSEIVESPLGFHLVQTTAVHKGLLKYGDDEVTRVLKLWINRKIMTDAEAEAKAKYAVVGIRAPADPPPTPPPATKPAPTTRPRYGATTRPHFSPRKPTTLPAKRATPKPATRPAAK